MYNQLHVVVLSDKINFEQVPRRRTLAEFVSSHSEEARLNYFLFFANLKKRQNENFFKT